MMARTAKRRAKRKPRMDWVYRGRQYLQDGSAFAGGETATYSPVEFTVPTGAVSAVTMVLVDSHNYLLQGAGVDIAGGRLKYVPSAARPRQGGLTCHAVEGTILYRPSVWAAGNRLEFCWRIIVAEQDTETGSGILQAEYGVWPLVSNLAFDSATWANYGYLKEGFLYQAFENNNDLWRQRVFWSGRVKLRPYQALFLYLEGRNNAVPLYSNLVTGLRLRTLVSGSD